MNEWTRLTPNNKEGIAVYAQHIADAVYYIAAGREPSQLDTSRLGQSFGLCNDEALAFARQLPEVQALVEAAKHIGCYRFYKPAEPEWETLQAALAPFEEA
jgi:hypothetical protein